MIDSAAAVLGRLCAVTVAVVAVSALIGCDLGIQASSARVHTDEADMLGGEPPPSEPPVLPPLPTDASGLLGMDPEHLLQRARRHPGKALIVNFWASFCGSCKDEIPLLLEMQTEFGPRGIELVMITADEPSDRGKAVALLRQFSVAGDSHYVHGGVGRFKRDIEPRWEGALPATVLIDKAGQVRHFWNGPVIDEEIRPVLKGFLEGRMVDGVTNVAASANP